VLSDGIRVQVTANPGETFLDRMIALVEGAERQKTPNEIALNILLAGLTIVFTSSPSVTLQSVCHLLERAAVVVRAGVAARRLLPTPSAALLSADRGSAGMGPAES
jgi:K+-transporting ATPase ATPase B chain